jgi:hypothetical protein
MIADHFSQALGDMQKAVRTFLPSLAPPPPPAPPKPKPTEAARVLSLAKHVEAMSARVARGMPPQPPQVSPEQQFGPELDPVHIRAIQSAIAAHPETKRAPLMNEVHNSLVRWIGSHNGRVIVDGKMEIAHTPQAAETLAAKIINGAVDEHDQRKAARATDVHGNRNASDRGLSEGVPSSTEQRSETLQPSLPADGRGTLQSAPEVVPPGDGKPPAQGPAPEVSPTEAAKVGTRSADGHLVTQPKNSIAANQKLALEAAPELDNLLQRATSSIPGLKYDRIRPAKSPDRLDQKLEDDNRPNTLSDYLGAQVSADSPQAKDALVDLLKKNMNVIEHDDHFLDGREDKAGYPSTNLQLQLGNGMTAEVQIVPKEVQEKTEDSHKFYKAGREAEAKGDNQERDRQWAQAKAIHDEALGQFKTRNGLDGQGAGKTSPPAGYQVLGEPIRIGSHTFLRVQADDGGSPAPSQARSAEPQAAAENVKTAASAPGADRRTAQQSAPTTASESQGQVPAAVDEPQRSDLPSPNSTALRKGDVVTLRDGRQAEIRYAHPNLDVARVLVDGKMLQIKPSEDIDDAPQG